MNDQVAVVEQDENQLISLRREKLAAIREAGVAFPNDFVKEHDAQNILAEYDKHDKAWFEENAVEVRVAGRIMLKRVMGKASFITISDTSGRLQLYVQQGRLGEELYGEFKGWDIGF